MNPSLTRRKALTAIAGIIGIIFTKRLLASGKPYDSITSATSESISMPMQKEQTSKVLLVLVSFHHKNTEKVANAMAAVLKAPIKSPQQVNIEELQKYELIGFGSGIYDQMHHKSVLDLIDNLPNDIKRKVFIYSTSGISRKTCLKHSIDDPHTVIRKKLQGKGCQILDEFNCAGWNTNLFLKIFGGMNKGKPNGEDLKQAKEFAENLKY
jgi:flavodoxin